MSDLVGVLLLLLGVALMLVAAIGLLRLPDALSRSHAVAKAMSAGIAFILLGTWVKLGAAESGVKLALALVFQFATIPVASQLLGRAAMRLRIPLWRGTSLTTPPAGEGRSSPGTLP